MKNVLIISTSLRGGSNSELLAAEIGDPKDAVNHPDVMEKAYELGKEI